MLSRHHQIALLDPSLSSVLVVPTDEGPRLPREPRRWASPPEFVETLKAPGATLIAPPWREDDGLVTNVFVGESSGIEGATWRSLDDLDDLGLSPESIAGLRRTVSERREGPPDDGRAEWFLPGWLEASDAWIEEQLERHGLARAGDIEMVKMWSLSAVRRVPVVQGDARRDLWFKATCDGFRGEPALTQAVCQLEPDLMPRVLAVEPDRAWMLMETIEEADDGTSPEHAADVARALARLQLDTLDRVGDLRAAGAPDRGLDETLAWLHTVVHDSVELPMMTDEQQARAIEIEPLLAQAVRDLWAVGVPDALTHGDLHLGNVAWAGDHPVFFDWTDLCVSHPFLDVRHLANDAAGPVEDPAEKDARRDEVWQAYAEAWREARPDLDVDAAWPLTRVVNEVFQMISYEQIYRAQPEASRWELSTVVIEVLDKSYEVLTAR